MTNGEGLGVSPPAVFTPRRTSSRPSFLPRPVRKPLHPGARGRGPGRGVTGLGHSVRGRVSQGPRGPRTRETPTLGQRGEGQPRSHLLGCVGTRPPAPGRSTGAAAPRRPHSALSAAILAAAACGKESRAEVPPAPLRGRLAPIAAPQPPSWKLARLPTATRTTSGFCPSASLSPK